MISGGFKFFTKNYALYKDGATITATSNTSGANAVIDVNKYTQWTSVGSTDAITETLLITLKTAQVINRLFLIGMNFKQFSVKYWNGSTYADFTSVIGINAEVKSGIQESTYAKTSAYYEFDSVTTNIIQVSVLKTQVVNVQKFLTTFIVTKEIGTFKGFPRASIDVDRNEAKAETLSSKFIVQKGAETTTVGLNFKSHPYQNDLDILDYLFNSEEPFLVYPCGGRDGETYFKVNQKGWRIGDVVNMQMVGKMPSDFEKGVYILGFNKTIKMEEHI